MTPDQIIKNNIKYVKGRIADKGDICPLFILHTEKSMLPVFCPWDNDGEKDKILTLMRVLMIKHRVYAYSVCTEAWVAVRKLDDAPMKGQVKDQPDKKEVCLVGYVGYDRQELVMLPIIRDGEKVKLGESDPEKPAKVSGRFFELLPPPEVHEKPFTEFQEQGLKLMLEIADKLFGIKVEEIPVED